MPAFSNGHLDHVGGGKTAAKSSRRHHDPGILSADLPALNGFADSGAMTYPCQPLRMRSAMFRFQCPECGIGDHELGPIAKTEIHFVVCLEEHGRAIRVHCWEEEADQARLREGLLAA